MIGSDRTEANDRITPCRRRNPRRLRALSSIAILAALAACSQSPRQTAIQESARYAAHAHRNYTPPGPPEDPWGPYIRQAAVRFDMPETWVRSVMRVESGGQEYVDGNLVTSGVGAMGLMQVMPQTYDELRDRYNLGDDPYDPHDNITAGVAYMREMYDVYGTPGFLAAYNAGPARLDDYLGNHRPLPDETRRYVAMIAPNLQGIYPNNRSAADQFAMNALPVHIPPGRRYGRPVMLAGANGGRGGRVPKRMPVEVAQLPEPPRYGGGQSQQAALLDPPAAPAGPQVRHGFRLITTANAAEGRSSHTRLGGSRPVGDSGWRVRQSGLGSWCADNRTGARARRTRRGTSVRDQRASRSHGSVACADEGHVAGNRGAGL
jgi:Transglycosylase SLT domain